LVELDGLSIVTVNYNSSDYVLELADSIVSSLESCDYCLDVELIVIDNASEPVDFERLGELRSHSSIDIKLWRNNYNLGYAGAVNIGVRVASRNNLMVSNPDIVLGREFMGVLSKIIYNKINDKKIIAPKILIKRSNTVNSKGLDLHIAGYGILRGLGEPPDKQEGAYIVTAPHGALFISDRRTLLDLGPFDPYLYAFLEDLDLGLRAWAKGYPVVYIPSLTAYHDWGVSWGRGLSRTKYYLVERNRLLVLARDYPRKLLATGLPFIVLSEIFSLAYALMQGYTSMKARVYGDFALSLPRILRQRRSILRDDGESRLMGALSDRVVVDFRHVVFEARRVALVNRLFRGLARLLAPLIPSRRGAGT